MTRVEYWSWGYRNRLSGELARRTFRATTADAARLFPGSERLEGTRVVVDFPDDDDEVTKALRTRQREHLAQADRHISSGEARIEAQRVRIAQLDLARHDTAPSVSLLSTFVDCLDTMQRNRAVILRDLSRATASSGGWAAVHHRGFTTTSSG